MRAYSTAVVATALGVSRHWLDAVVAAGRIPGVQPDRQGRSRAFGPSAVVAIAIALDLTEHLGTSLPVALGIAAELVAHGAYAPLPELSITLDVRAIERRVAVQLSGAVEASPPARRGRPPKRRADGDRDDA